MHLIILFSIGMLSIGFILITSVQRLLITAAAVNGRTFVSGIERIIAHSEKAELADMDSSWKFSLSRLVYDSEFSCLKVFDFRQRLSIEAGGTQCSGVSGLQKAIEESMQSGNRQVRYSGRTWGVYWPQEQYMLIAAPAYRKGKLVAGVGVVFPLERIYQRLRRVQLAILFYVLLNTAVLTVIGGYGLSQLMVKPLKRLVKRADNYRHQDDMFFLHDRDSNEFNKLSAALNHMLNRIAEDKIKLEESITSLEKVNLELKSTQQGIIRAEKLATVGRLSSGIAHEIGNPLGIVMGYLELLKQNRLSEAEKKDYIRRAANEINRINVIIGRLLESARASQTDVSSVSVHDILKDIVTAAKVQPITGELDFELKLLAGDDCVQADPDQLRQVFLNLIINAADAVAVLDPPVKGKLQIQTENVEEISNGSTNGGAWIRIFFADNGSGISEGSLENLFDPFFTTKAPGKGTGLGLSVSYTIIEGIGGTIEAAGGENGGTIMTIMLPVKTDKDR